MKLDKLRQIARVVHKLLALIVYDIGCDVVEEARVVADDETCNVALRLEPIFKPSDRSAIQLYMK